MNRFLNVFLAKEGWGWRRRSYFNMKQSGDEKKEEDKMDRGDRDF